MQFALSCQGIALLGNAERGVLRHIPVQIGVHVQDGGRQSLISTWRWALDTVGEFLASRPALARRLAVNAFVLMAGLFLMLARTSPALAADNSHGQGKAQDRTSASAVVQRHDDASHSSDHQIGGSGGGDGKGTTKGTSTKTLPPTVEPQ